MWARVPGPAWSRLVVRVEIVRGHRWVWERDGHTEWIVGVVLNREDFRPRIVGARERLEDRRLYLAIDDWVSDFRTGPGEWARECFFRAVMHDLEAAGATGAVAAAGLDVDDMIMLEWDVLSDEDCGSCYDLAEAPRPRQMRMPCPYADACHRDARAALSGARRMPRRGQRFDRHLPLAYSLGPGQWRPLELYRRWLQDGDALTSRECDRLGHFLACVLGPAGLRSSVRGAVMTWDYGLGDVVISPVDLRAGGLRAVLDLHGWPQGAPPSVPHLVSHILDRLEYDFALDIALGGGEYGEMCEQLELYAAADNHAAREQRWHELLDEPRGVDEGRIDDWMGGDSGGGGVAPNDDGGGGGGGITPDDGGDGDGGGGAPDDGGDDDIDDAERDLASLLTWADAACDGWRLAAA